MFKSKVKFEAFDRNNEKVKDIDPAQQKALCKAGTKKLAGKPGVKTNYHFIYNYFLGPKKKPIGHFMDLGEHKKLTKHFEQVEMKSGKPEKRMSANPKEASTGFAYVDSKDGKTMLFIEPSPNCKVPGGKWPKYLKALKSEFGGMKAVAIIGGQIMEESPEETSEETTTGNTDPTVEQNQQTRATKLQTIKDNIPTIEQAIGKISRAKLNTQITKYDETVQQLLQQIETAENTDETERKQIEEVRAQLEALRQNVAENGSRLSLEQQEKMRTNIKVAQETLDQLLAEMGI